MPPTKSAGPKLLSGFTDVPSMGIDTMCMSTSVKPIAMPANPYGTLSCVDPWTTCTNMKVKTISAIKTEAKE